MTEVIYRQGEAADLPAVGRMYADLQRCYREFNYAFPEVAEVSQAWLDSFRRTLGRFSMLHLAELDGKPAGFVLSRLKRLPPYMGGVLVGEISDVWVEPSARRLGAAENMMRMAIEWMQANGVYSVEAQIQEGNEPSWKLFERMGFEPELRQVRLMLDDPAQE